MPQPNSGMFGIPADAPGATPSAPASPAAPNQPAQGQPPAPAPQQTGQPTTPPAPGPQTPAPAPQQQGQPSPAPNAPQPTPQPAPGAQPQQGEPQGDDTQSQFAKHYQARYQKAMDFLGSRHPEVRRELSDFLSGGQPPASQAPQGTAPQTGSTPGQPFGQQQQQQFPTDQTGRQLADKAPDPMEDPEGYARYVSRLTAEENRKMMQAMQQESAVKAQQAAWINEYNEVGNHFEAFINPSGTPGQPDYDPGIPAEVVQEALQTVTNLYRIPANVIGGPTARFNAFTREVDRLMSKRTVNQRQTELTAEASAKAAQLAQMQQPSAAGAPSMGQKSPNQEHLEAMQGVKGRSFGELLRPKT